MTTPETYRTKHYSALFAWSQEQECLYVALIDRLVKQVSAPVGVRAATAFTALLTPTSRGRHSFRIGPFRGGRHAERS